MSLNKRLFTGGQLPGATIENAFQTVLYTGNWNGSNTNTVTGVGFQADFICIKSRDTSQNHHNYDSNRGMGKPLYFNHNYAQVGAADHLDVTSTGFTLKTDNMNGNGDDFVAWCWRANEGSTSSNSDGDITSTVQVNQEAGFSIINYQNNGSNSARVGHGLDATPEVVLIKKYSTTAAWHLMTTAIDGSFDDLILNTNGAKSDSSLTAPTSTTFAAESGGSGEDMMCYAWTPIAGYSKFGSYTGNGSTTGPTITLGFAPGLLILRKVGGDRWIMADNKRDTSNPNDKFLDAQDTHVESTLGLTGGVDFLSNGFQLKTTDGGGNANNETYFYMAWREAS